MPQLIYSGVSYDSLAGESVLEALLRQGVDIPNSCRAGACQSCLLRAATSHGTVLAAAQKGLKATLLEQGYFLSCLCRPDEDLVLEPAGGLEQPTTIEALERLTPTVLCVRLRIPPEFTYRAGQYLTLLRPDGLARSYSLASLPGEATLELHVRRAPNGRMSGWLFDQARPDDPVSIRGPAGDCFYTSSQLDQPLLLIGTGTGLAPLVGICRDALRQGHRGPIHLYHGALRPSGLYFEEQLRETARLYPQMHYRPVVLEAEDAGPGLTRGALEAVVAADHPQLAGWRGFVCGDPRMVRLLKKKLFLGGMASREIYADEFVEAPPVPGAACS